MKGHKGTSANKCKRNKQRAVVKRKRETPAEFGKRATHGQ